MEISIIILVSSLAFVLGAIIGSGKHRNEEEEALIGSLGLPQLNKTQNALSAASGTKPEQGLPY